MRAVIQIPGTSVLHPQSPQNVQTNPLSVVTWLLCITWPFRYGVPCDKCIWLWGCWSRLTDEVDGQLWYSCFTPSKPPNHFITWLLCVTWPCHLPCVACRSLRPEIKHERLSHPLQDQHAQIQQLMFVVIRIPCNNRAGCGKNMSQPYLNGHKQGQTRDETEPPLYRLVEIVARR